MPFDLNTFLRHRPYLYHLTAQENIGRIRRTRTLESAASLFEASRRADQVQVRRPGPVPVQIEGVTVRIRDQAPLHERNVLLPPGWTFEDLVALLNRQVFFWPGNADGPILPGRNHFDRYASENPTVLRVPTGEIIAANPDRPPTFSPYNSGAPRRSAGRPSPRGPDTFLPAEAFHRSAGRVIEVTFSDQVRLPDQTEVSHAAGRPWEPLFTV